MNLITDGTTPKNYGNRYMLLELVHFNAERLRSAPSGLHQLGPNCSIWLCSGDTNASFFLILPVLRKYYGAYVNHYVVHQNEVSIPHPSVAGKTLQSWYAVGAKLPETKQVVWAIHFNSNLSRVVLTKRKGWRYADESMKHTLVPHIVAWTDQMPVSNPIGVEQIDMANRANQS